ncbi:glycosyl transferase [Oceanisphaera profunda]|uniref:Glycosyl transferase n=1 Tax=Oceanisphaera profunda TaxID=1416627 RepID=A0A1Y0D2L1_9GAMM|nr:DUF1972 domain-containing protein [Oceanisphaera profunda]ART81762.1 glycosyl transferase [Oceanisphaera profunda]
MNRQLTILGIRGVPAAHGGFETFAEQLSLYLVANGWKVTVYCQEEGSGQITESNWCGVRRVHIPVRRDGALGTILFDWQAARHAKRQPGVCLTLGYNTAIFNLWQRLSGQANLFNMDGLEWQRDKWSVPERTWLWLNERFACWLGQHLIADHPRIKDHLATRVPMQKISMIPYGAHAITTANAGLLAPFGLVAGEYSVIIARPEPENSILEMVQAFSAKVRDHTLVVLGKFESDNAFHQQVLAAASNEVRFVGAIYEADVVGALRFFCRCYLHGHRVGGTNPSLVEALGAGNAVIAHKNAFNRWVADDGAAYFENSAECARLFDILLEDDAVLAQMRAASRLRFNENFTWPQVLAEYEILLESWLSVKR